MSENKNPNNRAQRKKAVAVWKRRLAWVTLPIFLISTYTDGSLLRDATNEKDTKN